MNAVFVTDFIWFLIRDKNLELTSDDIVSKRDGVSGNQTDHFVRSQYRPASLCQSMRRIFAKELFESQIQTPFCRSCQHESVR